MPTHATIGRLLAVTAAAALGGWAGRLLAAVIYGESLSPHLRLSPTLLFRQDITPGLIIADLIGDRLKLSIPQRALLAALAGAASVIVTGPRLVGGQPKEDQP